MVKPLRQKVSNYPQGIIGSLLRYTERKMKSIAIGKLHKRSEKRDYD